MRALWRMCMVPLGLVLFLASRGGAQALPDTLFTGSTRLELERIIASARALGLPTAPLVNRALQGAARRVDGQRVVGIVRAWADSMRVSQTLLGSNASAGEIDAGAAALRAGVPHDGLRQVRAARPGGQATTALIVLTDLVRRGAPPADAALAVSTLATKQTDQALLSLQHTIARSPGTPTAAQLRDAVQRQLQQRLPQTPDDEEPLVRALDTRTSPSAGHRAWFGLSALDAPRPAGGVGSAFEGGFSLARGEGLSVTFGGRAGRDATDLLVLQLRGGLAYLHRVGPRSAIAGWLGVESRPMPLVATWGTRPDTAGDLGTVDRSPDSLRHRRGLAIIGGASAARTLSPRLALGALLQVEGDQIATRSRKPAFPGAAAEHSRPDTLPYIELVAAAQRLFVHTSLNAVIGSLGLHGAVTHRLVGPRVSGDRSASRSLWTLAAEQQVGTSMSAFVALTSREPSSVLGAVLPAEARLRIGARLVERQVLKERDAAIDAGGLLGVTVERVDKDGARAVGLSLRAPTARTVWVQGDFTGWEPVRLTMGPDGRFSGTFAAPSDVVRFRVRLDDGPWRVPPGLATDWDDYGGEVGVAVLH